MEYKSIRQAVKVLQAQEDMTQEGLAHRVGVCRPALARTIGKPDHRIVADLLPIAQALGCSLELRFVRPDGSVAAVVPYRAGAAEEEQTSRDD